MEQENQKNKEKEQEKIKENSEKQIQEESNQEIKIEEPKQEQFEGKLKPQETVGILSKPEKHEEPKPEIIENKGGEIAVSRPKKSFKELYDTHYKKLFAITLILLIGSLGYIFYFYNQTGDIIYKDVTLSGGTSITIYDSELDMSQLEEALSEQFEDLTIRKISDLTTNRQIAIILETNADLNEIQPALEQQIGYTLDDKNSSIEFTGSSLGANFYTQLRFAIILAFILMAIVVFIIFRTFVPSIAVILSAFADITMTLAFVNLMGIRLSTAGIVAFLMLIGYSVDTDILLTTRMIKRREKNLNTRMLTAFKTGITMTLTSLAAVFVAFLIVKGFSSVLSQIFLILVIGLSFDLLNTWITNASILKLYCEKKGIE